MLLMEDKNNTLNLKARWVGIEKKKKTCPTEMTEWLFISVLKKIDTGPVEDF